MGAMAMDLPPERDRELIDQLSTMVTMIISGARAIGIDYRHHGQLKRAEAGEVILAGGALYLALGAVGLPVFAEHSSGIGVFSGPSGGYLIAFPLAAALGGFLVKYVARDRRTRALVVFACSITASVLLIHLLGILGMKLYFDVSWREAVTYDLPFWIGDVVKTSLVAMIAAEVHRAFPQLLQRD